MIGDKFLKNRLYIHWRLPLWLVFSLCVSFAVSCQKPPIKINLISDQVSYKPQEPISIQIRVFNINKNIFGVNIPVIARYGFFDQDFHLRLAIIDPNGLPIPKKYSGAVSEPPPPYRLGEQFLVPVEIIFPNAQNVYVMNDARRYYHLGDTYGWYTAVVRTPLETFSSFTEDPTGKPYAELFSRCGKTYNPLSSNKIRFEITPVEPLHKAALRVHVNLLITTTDGSQQKVSALENAGVRLYRVSNIPPEYEPISKNVFGIIWNNVKSQQSGLTYANGKSTFSGVEQADYLILVRHPSFERAAIIGKLLTKDDAQWQTGRVVELDLSFSR